MTDTLLDYDPNDTGDIPRPIGEARMRIDLGEKTQRIDPRTIHASVVGAIPRKVIEIDDTVTFHIPETIGVVADTAQLTLLGSLGATIEGELRPAAPGPFPVPLPPDPKPAPEPTLRRSVPYAIPADAKPWSVPRHGKAAPLWTRLAIAVGAGMVLGAALGLAILAVFW